MNFLPEKLLAVQRSKSLTFEGICTFLLLLCENILYLHIWQFGAFCCHLRCARFCGSVGDALRFWQEIYSSMKLGGGWKLSEKCVKCRMVST